MNQDANLYQDMESILYTKEQLAAAIGTWAGASPGLPGQDPGFESASSRAPASFSAT